MEAEMKAGALPRKLWRMSLASPESTRKALCRILRTYALASPEERESAEYMRVLISGLSSVLADYRKEKEIELVSKVEDLEKRLELVVGGHGHN